MVPYCENCKHFRTEKPGGWFTNGWPSRCHLKDGSGLWEAFYNSPHGVVVSPKHCCWDWQKLTEGERM